MNLHKIKETLMRCEKAVFSINEIARIFGMKKNVASVYVNRMLKKGLIFKIERNKLSLTDDPFIIASQLVYPAYISFVSALYLHNAIQQVINKIYVVTPKKRRKIRFSDSEIVFITLSPKCVFGYRKIKKENSFIMLADLEKAIIDCLALAKYCRVSYLLDALKKADINKLENYLLILKKEAVNRRVGYMLDLLKIKHSMKRKGKTIYTLNPTIDRRGKFNKKWYLYINEELT